MKHKSKGASTLLWVVVAIVALSALGVVNLQNLGGGLKAATGTKEPTSTFVPTQTAKFICQTDGTNSLDVAVPNTALTGDTDYTATTALAVGSDGRVATTGTTTGGQALSYLTLNVPCSENALAGRVCAASAVSGAANYVNSKCVPYDLTGKLSDQRLIGVANATNLTFVFRSTALANTSATTAQAVTETAATTMGSGDSRSVYLDIVNTTISSTDFGNDDCGVLVSIDTADSSVFSDKALSLSVASGGWSLQELPACPAQALSFNSANRCYKASKVSSSAGLIRLSGTLNADLGNPGTSADPIVYFDDLQSFEEDGVLKECALTNRAGTSVGAARNSMTFDNS